MSLTMLLLVFLVALLFVLVSIIKFNLHPFLSLLIGGLIMGLLTGMNLMKIADSLAKLYTNGKLTDKNAVNELLKIRTEKENDNEN